MTVMLNALPFLWEGLLVTLKLSALAVAIALVLGLILGVGLVYGPRWLYWPIRLYSDILRGLPTPVLIFAVYYLLPVIGWNIDNFIASVLALSTFEAARVLEVTRGAIQSIHPGQTDAGKAIGLTFSQRMIYVIFPQALRRFLPPWINSVVDTVKGSSLASFLGIVELTLGIQQVIGRTFEPMPLYILGIMIYFAINFTLSTTSRRLEARFAYIRE
jgi:polar amino acid transport system permease protein